MGVAVQLPPPAVWVEWRLTVQQLWRLHWLTCYGGGAAGSVCCSVVERLEMCVAAFVLAGCGRREFKGEVW